MKTILDTYTPDVELMETPGKAVVDMTPELANRILELSHAVVELKTWCIQVFEYSPIWTVWAEDKETGEEIPGSKELRTEGDLLCVTENEYWWQMEPKHSGVTVRTDYLQIDQLKRMAYRRCDMALQVCEALVEAREQGERRGGSMEWDDLDKAYELAQAVLNSFYKET